MSNFTWFYDFPKVDLLFENNNKNTLSYPDIYRFIDVTEADLISYDNYDWYEIEDGERPDHVSYKLYGTPDFYWTFFIVNERLKNGYGEWYRSQSALDKFVEEKYDNYGVCTIAPDLFVTQTELDGDKNVDLLDGNSVADLFELAYDIDLLDTIDVFLMIKAFQGLDVSYPNLRVKRTASNQSETKFAKIKYWDESRYQLYFDTLEVEDPFFFDDIPENVTDHDQIEVFLINPYEQYADSTNPAEKALYDAEEANNLNWLKTSGLSWYNSFYPGGSDLTDAEIQTEIESKLKFQVRNFYERGSLAPEHFVSPLTGERLCNTYCTYKSENASVPIPYFEYERNLNEEKRFIRVIQPSKIFRFVENYKEVLRASGRLAV